MQIRDKVQAVKAAVSMVTLLQRHGIRVSAGSEAQINCPFHDDSTPSARVYTTTNTIYCWFCHKVWDVIAVEMELQDCSLSEAVDSLIAEFKVDVAVQPQVIARFYLQATRYQRGDEKQTAVAATDLAYRFRRYYMSLPDWRLLEHMIDYFWQEYDEIVSSNLDAVQLLDRVVDWYGRAHTMLSAQVPAMQQVSVPVDVARIYDPEEADELEL